MDSPGNQLSSAFLGRYPGTSVDFADYFSSFVKERMAPDTTGQPIEYMLTLCPETISGRERL